MAYTQLGGRTTYYVASGTSNPEEFDLRGWGTTYYDQTAEDLANNRSRIKLVYGIDVVGSDYSGTYTLTAKVQKKVNGSWTDVQTSSYTQTQGHYTLEGRTQRGTITDAFVPHDSNGIGQVRSVVIISNTAWSGVSRSFYYIYDLPNINVTSTITNNSTQSSHIDFGSNVTFTITRPSTDVTHTLTYTVNGTTTTIGTGITTSKTYAFPTSLVTSFPGTEYPTIYVTCTSTNGTSTGTTVYLHVPNSYQPSCTLAIQEAATMPSGISVYVKGKSKIKGTITASMGSDGGATVASYSTPINGTTYTTQTFTTEFLTNYGSQSVTSTITDTRGRPASNTKSYTVYDYFTPTLTNYSVKRCNSSGVVDEQAGTYGLIQFTYNIAPVNNQNSKSVQVTCNGTTKTISLSNYSGTYTGTSNLFSGLSVTGSYPVTFKIIDSFNSSGVSYTYTVTPAFTTMSCRSGGKGVSFGQIATADDFHCYMKAYFHSEIHGLLDAMYPIGSIYISVRATNPNTLFGGEWTQLKNAYLFATNATSGDKGTITGSGKDTGTPSSDATGSTVLTVDQIPSHKHDSWARNPSASSSPNYTSLIDTNGTGASHLGWKPTLSSGTNKIMETSTTGGGQGHTHTLGGHTHTIANCEVYVWKRIS